MNYRQQIANIINSLSQDKGVNAKWRNKAVARLEDADLYLLKAGLDNGEAQASLETTGDTMCICRKNEQGKILAMRRSCPLHGEQAMLIAAKSNTASSDTTSNS